MNSASMPIRQRKKRDSLRRNFTGTKQRCTTTSRSMTSRSKLLPAIRSDLRWQDATLEIRTTAVSAPGTTCSSLSATTAKISSRTMSAQNAEKATNIRNKSSTTPSTTGRAQKKTSATCGRRSWWLLGEFILQTVLRVDRVHHLQFFGHGFRD